jgi:hypothetical protein
VFRQTRELVRFPGSGEGEQDNTPPAKLPALPPPIDLTLELSRESAPSDDGVFLDRQPIWFKLGAAVAALYGAYLLGWSNAEPAHGTAAPQPPVREVATMIPPPPPTEPVTVLAPAPQVTPSTASRRVGYEEIREIQTKLEALGYDPGPVDGLHGPQTVAAVKRYEIATGREPTGNIDLRLLERLRQEQ